jgi:hypothetical protein
LALGPRKGLATALNLTTSARKMHSGVNYKEMLEAGKPEGFFVAID